MALKGKSIRTLDRIVLEANGATDIRLGRLVREVDAEVLEKIGFEGRPELGDSILPAAIGRVTDLNANGREIVRRDLPLAPHSVSMFRSWEDWHGQTHHGIQYRDVMKYPRELIPPPSEELQIVEVDDEIWIATRPLSWTKDAPDTMLHAANLMLECFGEFAVIDEKSGKVVQREVRTLSWQVLPRGRYPWDKARPALADIIRTLRESEGPVVEDRWRAITRYEPSFIARGVAGFAGYVVFGFPEKGLYFLESAYLGNATYVFDEDWEALSKLTKADVIQGRLAKARITHDRKWKTAIHGLLNR